MMSSYLVDDLRRLGVENIGRFQKALSESVADRQRYLDYLAEGKAALTITSNGFHVVYEPLGRPGPDLLVTCSGYSFYVEVSRFREDYETSQKLSQEFEEGNEILVEYGRGEKDVESLYCKVLHEAEQLPKSETGLVFLRSDNIRMEDLEFQEAATYLDSLVEQNLLAKLSGVLFDSGWFNFATRRRFYLWRNQNAESPIDDLLAEKLTNLTELPTHSGE
jgi:hypothetical protein